MFWSSLVRTIWKPIAAAVGAALLPAACARSGPADAATHKTVADWFAVKVGDRTVQMQLAIYDPEMELGLMRRRDLGPDQGMLFVYRVPTKMSFWMRNTPLPLDIGFFGRDGVLQEIYPMYPFDETPVRSRSAELQFALEMNQGWFGSHGIKPGAHLDLAALREALKARGAEPADFGLP